MKITASAAGVIEEEERMTFADRPASWHETPPQGNKTGGDRKRRVAAFLCVLCVSALKSRALLAAQ